MSRRVGALVGAEVAQIVVDATEFLGSKQGRRRHREYLQSGARTLFGADGKSERTLEWLLREFTEYVHTQAGSRLLCEGVVPTAMRRVLVRNGIDDRDRVYIGERVIDRNGPAALESLAAQRWLVEGFIDGRSEVFDPPIGEYAWFYREWYEAGQHAYAAAVSSVDQHYGDFIDQHVSKAVR